MSALLNRLFGNRKPTSTTLGDEIDKQRAALDDARARIEAAGRAYQAAVDAIDKTGMRAAGAARLDAEEDVILAERALAELRQEREARLAAEARDALEARTAAAKRRVTVDASKALDRYERAAAEVASAAEVFIAIEAEVAAVNIERRNAGLPPIARPTDAHRKEPDRHIPERRETETKWFRKERGAFGGFESEIGIFRFDEKGERVPSDGHGNRLADAYTKTVERVVRPESIIRGAELPSFAENLKLPPARVGSARHWPKGE